MNPYFQNQYPYPNQQTQYGYQQQNFSNLPPQSIQPDISAMYNTVQPYNNEEFLVSTFGRRPDYIRVFLSLSHDDKLMMYMLTQQKKIYGQIRNKQSYQRLLKEIAQKVQNYQNFYGGKKLESKEEKKSKELEHKIDDIVEKTFEKLNLSDVGHVRTKKKEEEVLVTEEDEEDEEEWVQSKQSPELPPLAANHRRESEKKTKQPPYPLPEPIFNMFSFDSQMQKAMTQQIGLTSEIEKKSIWDLQLQEDQVRGNEPNLKDIFKSKSSGISMKIEEESSKHSIPRNQDQKLMNYQSEPISHMDYSSSQTNNQNSLFMSQSNAHVQKTSEFDNLIKSDNGVHYEFSKQISPQLEKGQNQQFVSQIDGIKQLTVEDNRHELQAKEDDEDFVDGDVAQQKIQTENIFSGQIDPKMAGVMERKEEKQTKAQDNLDLFELYESTPGQVDSSPGTHFDFDFLGGYSQPPEIKVEPTFNDHAHSHPVESTFNDYSHFQPAGSEVVKELNSKQSPQEREDVFSHINRQQNRLKQEIKHQFIHVSSPINQLFNSNNAQNYSVLSKLKVQLPPSDEENIIKILKNKSFECDTQFYQIMMNFLSELSLRNSEEYNHFKEQYEVIKQIHEETDKYTKAVDEDEEQKILDSIKKTKILIQKILSAKTQQYAALLLSPDHPQKGFLFKFGKILVDSCISQEILEKIVAQESFNQIENSFYILYVLEKCNALNSSRLNIQKIMSFVNKEYEKYRSFDIQMINQIEELPQKPQKYLQYVRGFVKILQICERMIVLLKALCMKSHSNMVKTLKICKDMKAKFYQYREESHEALLPQVYKDFLREGVETNSSLYDLHLSFSDLYAKEPLCKVCLHSIRQKGGEIEGYFYHYACFNLLEQIERSTSEVV